MLADCHIHIIDPARFPLAQSSPYRPTASDICTRERVRDTFLLNGVTHGVAVDLSFDFADHAALTDALTWSKGWLKGVAELGPDVGHGDLVTLNDAGIVGQRFDLTSIDLAAWREQAGRRALAAMSEFGWHGCLQMNAGVSAETLTAAIDLLSAAKLPILFDHYSQPDVSRGLDQPVFAEMIRCGKEHDTTIVKLSSFFRHSRTGVPYSDLDPFMDAIREAFGVDRCIYGSDFPFIVHPGPISVASQLDAVSRWFKDPSDRRKVLADNPARLFGFEAAAGLSQSWKA